MSASNDTLQNLRKRWQATLVFALLLPSLGMTLLATALCHFFRYNPGLGLLVLPLFFGWMLARYKPWKLNESEVARIIDREMPQTEESTALLLKNPAEMTLLEKLQSAKIAEQMSEIRIPQPLKKLLIFSVLFSIAFFIAGSLLMNRTATITSTSTTSPTTSTSAKPLKPETILPTITSVSVSITPPAYTGKSQRNQTRFGLNTEKNSRVKWVLETNIAVQPVFVFNGKMLIKGKALNAAKTRWELEKIMTENGFYQVQTGNKKSELYPVEIIADRPPLVRISKPQPYSTIDVGQPQQSTIQLRLSDDYGLSSAFLSTTIASGKGESVKFKEEKTALPNVGGRKSASIQKLLDLKKMGMQPGDELYFFVSAQDNNRQQSRSDVYIIAIADTAELMSMNGLVSGVNLVPEYFRSQRQIIIETEQLIKGRDTLSKPQFNAKSNDLGFDQKVLRLRYGKFLGEENESGGPHEHDDGDHDEPKTFGDAQAIIEPYTHKHDNAEDATFFEPQQKKQLKDVLTEMWKAELRLRTYKPQEALPFEYKALRLLKDLQQSQRAYVAKTSYTSPPIKPDKRLSGELDKIGQPQLIRKNETDFRRENSLKSAASVLGSMQRNTSLTSQQTQLLQTASAEIRRQATTKPAAFLPAVSAMQKVMNGSRNESDIRKVQSALQRILAAAQALPQAPTATPGSLSTQYFNQLNRQQK